MARALQPAVAAGEIFFELDRFELAERNRLELRGRWFGVRGRRFVRPTLTVVAEGGRSRALADLEHKPWAPEDGQAWEAAFPWDPGTELVEAELSVATDITIRLPIPSSELQSAQRLDVIAPDDRGPARPATRARARQGAEDESASTPTPTRRRRAPRPANRDAELQALRDELTTVRGELEQVRAELEAAQLAGTESANTAAAANVELVEAQERRDAAVNGLQAAIEARDAATRARDQAAAERDRERQTRERLAAERDRERQARERLAAERDRATQTARRISGQLEQAQAALEQAVREREQATEALDRALDERDALAQSGARLAQQRDDAIASRGAALVMRNASRALPRHERDAGWLQRGGAIVVLVGAVFALLIVLHVL